MLYFFYDYNLDSERRELRRNEQLIAIEPKVFQVLLYLLEHRDRVIPKDELLDQCWPDIFVSESALNRCLSRLRQAVQSERTSQQVIKTLHRQGYRFVAEVTVMSDEPIDTEQPRDTPLPQEPSIEPPTETASLQNSPIPAVPKSQLSPTAERRQLTVLFCDLVSSTALSEQIDPEDLHEVLNAYHAACAKVIKQFEGHVAQYLGDGLLVYFGYPLAYEDATRRSVHTGLGIIHAVETLNNQLENRHGIRLAVRIGIHTGLVVIGDVGMGHRVEQLAVGATPNIAARLQGLASPGTIVVSTETYDLIQGYFICEQMGEYVLTGVSETQRVYRVIEASGAQTRLDVARTRGLMPLVGREVELALLLDRWSQVQAGMGQVILLSGEAGIGKSRLVQALIDYLAEGAHTQLECRSLPYFTNSALYPIIDMIQRTLRFQNDDPPELKLAKLTQSLSQYRIPPKESVPLFGALLSLPVPEDQYPSLNLSPQRRRQKTLEAIVALVLELAERQPVLFILEDLHWTDPTTLEFLGMLIDQAPTASLCILMTCRPEFQPPWQHRSYLTKVTVNRLSPNQIAPMAEQVTGGKTLPTEIMQQLVNKTDGVPLYVEEMTKAILESGQLKEFDQRYEFIGSIVSLSIPATLQDSLMSRLDRLATAKAVAQYASVIGRQFSYELLQTVSDLDETILQHELGRLVAAELVYQRGFSPQATYTFKHALIQETAYASLLRSSRQQYHARIANVLRTQFRDVTELQPELLAHHYTEAGHNEQALDFWHRAGQQALQRSANLEAITNLNRGLELLPTLPHASAYIQRELDMLVSLRAALAATKGYASPVLSPILMRSRELCHELEDTSQHFLVLRNIATFHMVRGELQTALELNDQCLQLALSLGDSVLLHRAYEARGTIQFLRGELLDSKDNLEHGIALYDPQQHHSHIMNHGQDSGVTCHTYTASILWLLGYPDQASTRINEAITLARKFSHPMTLGNTLIHTAVSLQYCRETKGVEKYAQAALKLANEYGFVLWVASGMVLHGWCLAMQGEVDAGVAQMRQGLSAYRTTGSRAMLTCYLIMLAEGYCHMGHTEAAEEGLRILDETLELIEKTGGRKEEARAYCSRGELLLRQSVTDTTQAENTFHQALHIARNQKAKSLELRAAFSLAKLWQSQGKRQDAYDLLAPVYGWFTEGFDTADLREAKALLDELT